MRARVMCSVSAWWSLSLLTISMVSFDLLADRDDVFALVDEVKVCDSHGVAGESDRVLAAECAPDLQLHVGTSRQHHLARRKELALVHVAHVPCQRPLRNVNS